jgi:hypothetical protein
MKLVAQKGAEIVPESLGFSMSRRQCEHDLSWFIKKAQEKQTGSIVESSFSKPPVAIGSAAPPTERSPD